MKRLSLILISALCTASIQAQHVDFRGANHCGIYTNEKSLLKQWPEGGLARINPEKFDVVSEFRITDGSGACFSHPTIFDGVLYVRRGSALMAFNVKEP
jgi:hypothetical protein